MKDFEGFDSRVAELIQCREHGGPDINKKIDLLERANLEVSPPWGGWDYLLADETSGHNFTRSRTAVNSVIVPHEMDHIGFIPDKLTL